MSAELASSLKSEEGIDVKRKRKGSGA